MSSPPHLVPNKHQRAIDYKNTTGQAEDTNKNECYNSKRLLRVVVGAGEEKYCFCLFLYLGISLFLRK